MLPVDSDLVAVLDGVTWKTRRLGKRRWMSLEIKSERATLKLSSGQTVSRAFVISSLLDVLWVYYMHYLCCPIVLSTVTVYFCSLHCVLYVNKFVVLTSLAFAFVSGSQSLHLGTEIFDVFSMPMQDHNHLYIRQGTGLQGQALFKNKLSFR